MPKPDDDNIGPDGEPQADLAPPITMKDMEQAEELVEVYQADNAFAANAAIDEILGPAGIEAFAHDRRSHALPAPDTMPGAIGVAVHRSLAARARQLLAEARADGALLDEGRIVG